MDPAFALAIFALGLAFGSFLNVCIYRLPRDLSVIHPGSACPQVRTANPLLRQRPHPELADSAWTLPQLQGLDLAALSRGGAAHRARCFLPATRISGSPWPR